MNIPRASRSVDRTRWGLLLAARPALAGLIIGFAAAFGSGCGSESSELSVTETSQGEAEAIGGIETSTLGRYRVEVRPAATPVVLSAMHDWVVRLERTDGSTPSPSFVSFDGGMPSHGHGFTTQPRVTRRLGPGEFLVEGVKFHMGGPWELQVLVTDAEGTDRATIEISLTP